MNSLAPAHSPRNTPVQAPCEEEGCVFRGGLHVVDSPDDVMHEVEPIVDADKRYSVHADKVDGQPWEVWLKIGGDGTVSGTQAQAMAAAVETMERRISLLKASVRPPELAVARREVADKVRWAAAGMPVADMARATGIPLSTLKRRLAGHTDFSIPELGKIAAALEEPQAAFLTKVLSGVKS